jgi:hypothetical protein
VNVCCVELTAASHQANRALMVGWFFQSMMDADNADLSIAGVACALSAVTEAGELVLLSPMRAEQLRTFSDGSVELRESSHSEEASRDARTPVVRVHPASELVVLATSYRIVFSLDVSPSCASIDAETNEILIDTLLRTLERAWFALLDEFRINGHSFSVSYAPRIDVSVVAQMGLADTFWSVLQCARLTRTTVAGLLDIVRKRLEQIESLAADELAHRAADRFGAESSDLAPAIRNGVTALKRMPADARALLVLVTDGAVALPADTGAYDSLLMSLNRESIAVSSIQLGSAFAPYTVFGLVPDGGALRHIAVATHGGQRRTCCRHAGLTRACLVSAGCFFTSQRLAAVCNSQSHVAYANYLRKRHRLSEIASSATTPTTAAHGDSALPQSNLLQLRLLWNPFSPGRANACVVSSKRSPPTQCVDTLRITSSTRAATNRVCSSGARARDS